MWFENCIYTIGRTPDRSLFIGYHYPIGQQFNDIDVSSKDLDQETVGDKKKSCIAEDKFNNGSICSELTYLVGNTFSLILAIMGWG